MWKHQCKSSITMILFFRIILVKTKRKKFIFLCFDALNVKQLCTESAYALKGFPLQVTRNICKDTIRRWIRATPPQRSSEIKELFRLMENTVRYNLVLLLAIFWGLTDFIITCCPFCLFTFLQI